MMPKNIDATKSKMQSKSTRRPLRDVSNAKTAIKCSDVSKKSSEENGGDTGKDSLDRLLLVHSDVSSLLRQIDELVVQALQLTSKKGKMEIKQFADVLSEMQTTLKPWVPKFQKALSGQSTGPENESKQLMEEPVVCIPKENTSDDVIESPEQTKWESLISPSPLVSWRAGCNPEGGRQLFLLTPLPQKKAFSSKCKALPIPAFENIISDENKNLDIEVAKNECISPEKFSRTNCPMFVMTPCLKMSPPKSCILLEPVSEFSMKKNQGVVHKSTPFPVGIRNFTESQDSESSSSQEASDDLNVKYPELYGIKLIHNFGNKMKVVEDSPNWMVSPPKTCAIMEPTDENLLTNIAGNCLQPKKVLVDNRGDHGTSTKTYHQQDINGTLDIAESTPMVSVFRTGKHPGENTLKKELWTRFEAASTHAIRFDDSILQKTSEKGFLDRLEEEASDI
ncbi:hypothetical protein BUALT_Bualt07G0150200 [Buddleja alternifolia]|uniref:Uncharacterized protein n=1 Tax=Buddleja alternifolia TaxID=168488 RepID=A0AAV6XAB0_9LAMI|nr:hypothetical protein BUALT_Bualt07G0150200 [Buddleja alternifolia]